MSVLQIVALNIGAAALLTLILTALMLLPKRLHPHRHPHLAVHHHDAAPVAPSQSPERRERAQHRNPSRVGETVTDH